MRRVVCLVAAMVGATACSLFDRSAATSNGGGLRSFYLTKAAVQGNRALDACGRGYHMASRFEILDVSVLDYDSSIGLTTDDSGSGPPSQAAAYDSPGPSGWVRTGGGSRFTDAAAGSGSAATNCAAWSTNSAQAYGTVAYLADRFSLDGGPLASVWNGGSQPCDRSYHVWCVENSAARGAGASSRVRHGNRRREESESELRR